MLMHRWMLRETDLWKYTRSLQELDKMRVEGKFVDSDGNKPKGQYVSGYLLPQWLIDLSDKHSFVFAAAMLWYYLYIAV